MSRATAVFLCMIAASSRAAGTISMRGALFYDRGHYWIEIAFARVGGQDTLPPGLSPSRFEICADGGVAGCFRPSRIETLAAGTERASVLLVSARLEPRRCYRVVFFPAEGGTIVADSICDPFGAGVDAVERGSKAFFRKYVAAAFARDGDAYRLNRFSYEYDFSSERSIANLAIAPRFCVGPWTFDVLFTQGSLAYSGIRSGRTAVDRRSLAVGAAAAAWASDLRCSISLRYQADRSAFRFDHGDSTLHSCDLVVEGRVRFDNLFDPLTRPFASVFKGVEAAFGCARRRSIEGLTGPAPPRRPLLVPFVNARATWTFLYGFQLSYSLESYRSASIERELARFHSVRFRLLLRDVLSASGARPWHPDVEMAWDGGRRLPFFAREERLSIGFTFDLYAW